MGAGMIIESGRIYYHVDSPDKIFELLVYKKGEVTLKRLYGHGDIFNCTKSVFVAFCKETSPLQNLLWNLK